MLYIKALHILFVVTWFAGLFYIVRLFVYHSEANEKAEPDRSILINHFKGAERRLWYGITWPSAILTYIFGFYTWNKFYGSVMPSWLMPSWLIVKLLFVGGLTLYHLYCDKLVKEYRNDRIRHSGQFMRVWNEIATVFLVAIIFIVVLKDSMSWLPALGGLLLFVAVLMGAIAVYKKLRR
jgi:protoporphyrinogen IX oxidase